MSVITHLNCFPGRCGGWKLTGRVDMTAQLVGNHKNVFMFRKRKTKKKFGPLKKWLPTGVIHALKLYAELPLRDCPCFWTPPHRHEEGDCDPYSSMRFRDVGSHGCGPQHHLRAETLRDARCRGRGCQCCIVRRGDQRSGADRCALCENGRLRALQVSDRIKGEGRRRGRGEREGGSLRSRCVLSSR